MAYRLEPDETLVDGLLRVAGEAAAAAATRLGRADDDRASAAHEARKHGKEARAALRLLRGVLPAASHEAAREAVRDANRRLATARDAQAMFDTLERLRQRRRLLRRERQPAAAALRRQRDAALAGLDDEALAAAASRYRAVAAALDAAAATSAGAAQRKRVGEELARLYRRGRRRLRAASREGTSEAFHAWRRDAKDLWYAVRLFAPTWPGPLDALALELHQLSRALGDEHDLVVLTEGLGATGEGLLTARLARAAGREQEEWRAQALAAGARIWAEPPKRFVARLLAYHGAWSSSPRRPPDPR